MNQIINGKREGYWENHIGIGIDKGSYENDKKEGRWRFVSPYYLDEGEFRNGFKQGVWFFENKMDGTKGMYIFDQGAFLSPFSDGFEAVLKREFAYLY